MISNLAPGTDEITAYRAWLRGLVDEPALSQGSVVFEAAWDIEYIPTVPNDVNRAHDGIDLRGRFVRETSSSLPAIGKCTMLEFLVALSIRLNESDYDPRYPNRVPLWFWTLIENLEIRTASYDDCITAFNNINLRDYAEDGYGGLFPLRKPRENQRNVEIWYQMNAYLLENR